MKLTVERVVEYSIDRLIDRFKSSQYVQLDTFMAGLENDGREHFGLLPNISSRRLFSPVYSIFICYYGDSESRDGLDGEFLFWYLKNGCVLDKKELTSRILEGWEEGDKKHLNYKKYLEENLKLALNPLDKSHQEA